MRVFGINGFGRIGRTATRVWWDQHQDNLQLAVINTSGSMEIENWAHLLKYDSNYGQFSANIRVTRTQSVSETTNENPVLGTIEIEGRTIVVTAQRDPKLIPWGHHGVEVVIESTGVFTSAEKARWHIEGGAQKVLISAPGKGAGVDSSVIGVNDFSDTTIGSNASCTTNCVAPVMQVLESSFGIEHALMTTIHSYTDDQNTQDNSHKDMRRARSAAENIIPTTTGAAVAVTKIIPSLVNNFDGIAVRVPTPVGSLSDIVCTLKQEVTVEQLNHAFVQAAADSHWQGILAVTDEPVVSSDIVGRPESSIVDLAMTRVIGGKLIKIVSWYDNEFGYCNRLIEQLHRI